MTQMVEVIGIYKCLLQAVRSDDSPDFKEPLQVVDLSECHADEQEALEYSPPHHPRVGIVVDCMRRGRERGTISPLMFTGLWET